jgi:hypothetical protein
MRAAVTEDISVVEQAARRLPIQKNSTRSGGRASNVRAGYPGPRSQVAGAAMAKGMTADDSLVRRHVEADELPRGQE